MPQVYMVILTSPSLMDSGQEGCLYFKTQEGQLWLLFFWVGFIKLGTGQIYVLNPRESSRLLGRVCQKFQWETYFTLTSKSTSPVDQLRSGTEFEWNIFNQKRQLQKVVGACHGGNLKMCCWKPLKWNLVHGQSSESPWKKIFIWPQRCSGKLFSTSEWGNKNKSC